MNARRNYRPHDHRINKRLSNNSVALEELDKNTQDQLPAKDHGYQTRILSETGLVPTNQSIKPSQRKIRHKWTQEQKLEVMWCYFHPLKFKRKSKIKAFYEIWRQRNPDIFLNMNEILLTNVRRSIENSKKNNSF